MAVYNLSVLFQPQYVSNGAAAIVFATSGAPTAVPTGYNYRIDVLRVTNNTAAPVSLTVWRVPSGGAATNATLVTPVTVTVPVGTNTFPHFDVTALWGAVLNAGDAIFMQAGSANALVVQGDGMVIQL